MAKIALQKHLADLRGLFSTQLQREIATEIEGLANANAILVRENAELKAKLEMMAGPIPGSTRKARPLGPHITPADVVRLNRLNTKIWCFMCGAGWVTLADVAEHCNCETQTASAQLRLFRRPEYGGHTINAKRMPNNVWLYRLAPNPAVMMHGPGNVRLGAQ